MKKSIFGEKSFRPESRGPPGGPVAHIGDPRAVPHTQNPLGRVRTVPLDAYTAPFRPFGLPGPAWSDPTWGDKKVDFLVNKKNSPRIPGPGPAWPDQGKAVFWAICLLLHSCFKALLFVFQKSPPPKKCHSSTLQEGLVPHITTPRALPHTQKGPRCVQTVPFGAHRNPV